MNKRLHVAITDNKGVQRIHVNLELGITMMFGLSSRRANLSKDKITKIFSKEPKTLYQNKFPNWHHYRKKKSIQIFVNTIAHIKGKEDILVFFLNLTLPNRHRNQTISQTVTGRFDLRAKRASGSRNYVMSCKNQTSRNSAVRHKP